MNHAFLKGEKLYLRAVERDDLQGPMFDWAHDEDVTYYMFTGLRPNTPEKLEAEYRQLTESDNDFVFAICDKKTQRHIGIAGLYGMNSLTRSAEYRILIGEKKFWNQGYGQEVAGLLIQYGFEKLNLNKIWLGVNEDNRGAATSYKKSGFVEEGKLRQEIFRNGRYYNAIRMSILRSEYDAKKA